MLSNGVYLKYPSDLLPLLEISPYITNDTTQSTTRALRARLGALLCGLLAYETDSHNLWMLLCKFLVGGALVRSPSGGRLVLCPRGVPCIKPTEPIRVNSLSFVWQVKGKKYLNVSPHHF